MTREEALSKYDEIDRRTRSIRPYWEVRDLFNKIFDDFENKRCENCKWYELRNDNENCKLCERHPSRLVKNINIKDYWECKE